MKKNNKTVVIIANDTTYTYNLRGLLIKRLLKEDYRVYIIAEVLKFKEELENMGCKIIDLKVERHGKNPFNDLKLLNIYTKTLKEISPDVVLTYNIKPNIYGGFACKKLKIKFIPNITGLGTALEYPGIMQKITKTLYKLSLSKAYTVFFQNKENYDFFMKNKLLSPNTKSLILPGSGVDLSIHNVLKYPTNKTIKFLYVARIMKEKGIDIYLETAKQIKNEYKNVEFHICGYCDDDKYKEILKNYEKQNIIIYHGEQKNIIPFFEMANCIIHPSYYPEGMSNVLLESCAHARPIICTNRSGCKEIVSDETTGFIVPIKSTEAVIDAVKKFMNLSNKEMCEMGLAGRKKVEKEFDREFVVKEYLRVMEENI